MKVKTDRIIVNDVVNLDSGNIELTIEFEFQETKDGRLTLVDINYFDNYESFASLEDLLDEEVISNSEYNQIINYIEERQLQLLNQLQSIVVNI